MSGEEEWMEHCERMFANAIHDGVTGRMLDDLEEEYEDARRMYRTAHRHASLTSTPSTQPQASVSEPLGAIPPVSAPPQTKKKEEK